MSDFAAALESRLARGMAPAVVGLDPRPDALPQVLVSGRDPTDGILAFYREVLPVLAERIPVVKPNIAFFEAFGHRGYRVYEQVCALARDLGLLVIGDIKRGDIGSTAAAYAEEHFRHAHALTLHPYLGGDSVQPFLDRCRQGESRGVFVLVRTSNPGARDFQDLVTVADPAGRRPLCDAVADKLAEWADTFPGNSYSPVGAVVGATWAADIGRLRERMPRSWLLLPGVGAQGAKVGDLANAFDEHGRGALVNQSRGVMHCFAPDSPTWLRDIAAAAEQFAAATAEVAGL